MKAIRVGIVGTGFAAASHADALRRLPQVEVAAIAGSSRRKAEEAAARLGIGRGVASYEDLTADVSIAAIHNCTPNYLHAEINEIVLRSGKHLLSEKPLAMTSQETARLLSLAETSEVVSGVCFNYRHYPLVREVKTLLEGGHHGRPHFVHGNYLQDWLVEAGDWNWRLEIEKAGRSRAVADIGSHWLDLVQHVCSDRVSEVCADLATLHSERLRPSSSSETFQRGERGGALSEERVAVDTEDFASILLRFESGTRGAVTVSQVSPGRKNRLFFEIDTQKAAFAWDQEVPNSLWIGKRDEANRELVRDPTLLGPRAAALAHFPGGHQEGWPDGLRNLFLDFYEAVRAHAAGETYESSFATIEDAHRVGLVVEAIMGSAASARWVRVGEEKETLV